MHSLDALARLGTWMLNNPTGASSECIAAVWLGGATRNAYHPSDTGDLRRCLALMKAVPEIRDGFVERMTPLSAEWGALAARWDELSASLESETGLREFASAPRTSRLMYAILVRRAA